MRDEGYAAVTSRRVAEQAGLKPQLVHYYFRTMDDLFLEMFRRGADRIQHFHQLRAARPVSRCGRCGSSTPTPPERRLTMEYIALANHRKTLKAEIARYAETFPPRTGQDTDRGHGALRRSL